ncbi:hypothetical protein CH267_00930 [Rhodococcus sp. 06-621-2]|nr:head maturation protease, ClpP-related [Rhodococcus sp. 06-621-2]OZC62137.1 hypothetical protein CH267_00930 [Rhodococcus sp. 06-621-2]
MSDLNDLPSRPGIDLSRFRAAHNGGSRRDWYQFSNVAADDGPVEIMIYDEIGESWWGGVTAADFVRDLATVDADQEIVVRINSPGGDVYDGIAILNALRGHKAKVTTVVDGIAASAASFIAMAGNEIVMSRNAEMMIHEASGICIGNAEDMRGLADRLDKIGANIAEIYADRAGGKAEDWRSAMLAETWYSDQEAVDAGLADRIESGDSDQASKKKNKFDLSFFNYAGRAQAPNPQSPSAEPVEETRKNKENKVATLDEELRERLGVTDPEATEEDLLAALDERIATPADEDPTPGTASNAAVIPEGAVLVDSERLAALEANAALGVEARNRQNAEDRNAVIQNAVKAGKIPATRAAHWNSLLEKDPGIKDTLDAMAAGSAVPVGEVGHGLDGNGGAEHASALSQLDDITNSDVYKNWR